MVKMVSYTPVLHFFYTFVFFVHEKRLVFFPFFGKLGSCRIEIAVKMSAVAGFFLAVHVRWHPVCAFILIHERFTHLWDVISVEACFMWKFVSWWKITAADRHFWQILITMKYFWIKNRWTKLSICPGCVASGIIDPLYVLNKSTHCDVPKGWEHHSGSR